MLTLPIVAFPAVLVGTATNRETRSLLFTCAGDRQAQHTTLATNNHLVERARERRAATLKRFGWYLPGALYLVTGGL